MFFQIAYNKELNNALSALLSYVSTREFFMNTREVRTVDVGCVHYISL